ncbi:MAG: PASTA domain-containing protein [Armatimonadota bacterium]
MIDVLGRDLDEARSTLQAAGYRVEVTETRTRRPVLISGPLRVIRQRDPGDGVIHLVVTHEHYEPAPRVSGG